MEYQIMVDGIEIQSNEQVNEKEARAYISYIPVSYTHLDVYKRQAVHTAGYRQ